MNIKQYIKECVKEEMMRSTVKQLVAEELHRMWENGEINESLFEKDDNDSKEKDEKNKEKLDKEKADVVRAQLADMCDNPAVNKAAVAYKVLPGVAHDSARHIFNDMLDGEDNMSTKQATIGISYLQNQGLG